MKLKRLLIFAAILLLTGCGFNQSAVSQKYGVFIGTDRELSSYEDYDIIVIDAQYYTAEEIADYKGDSRKVYSYINVGSVENFRDYYKDYEDITLGDYEHWDEEKWVDVSEVRWQEFVLNELAPSLAEKGIDGFFVDNCDVYYVYHEPEILSGLSAIMRGLRDMGTEVVINSGDAFLDAYTAENGNPLDVVTGINQESVFTAIDWENGTFTEAASEDKEYFTDYIERYSKRGVRIFLLEYTKDAEISSRIKKYCDKNGFMYYIADSLELD